MFIAIYLYVILYYLSLSSRNTMLITFKYIYSLFSFLLKYFCISIIFFIFPDSSYCEVCTIIIPMTGTEGRALDASSRATAMCSGAGFWWLAAIFIILSTDSRASDRSTGSQIGSRLLVSAFIDHPLCTGFISCLLAWRAHPQMAACRWALYTCCSNASLVGGKTLTVVQSLAYDWPSCLPNHVS